MTMTTTTARAQKRHILHCRWKERIFRSKSECWGTLCAPAKCNDKRRLKRHSDDKEMNWYTPLFVSSLIIMIAEREIERQLKNKSLTVKIIFRTKTFASQYFTSFKTFQVSSKMVHRITDINEQYRVFASKIRVNRDQTHWKWDP